MNQQDYAGNTYNNGNAPIQAQQTSSYSNYNPQGMQQDVKGFQYPQQQNMQSYAQAGGAPQAGVYNPNNYQQQQNHNQQPNNNYQQPNNNYQQQGYYPQQANNSQQVPYVQQNQQSGYNNNNQPNNTYQQNQSGYNQQQNYNQNNYQQQPPQSGAYAQGPAPAVAGAAGLGVLQSYDHVTVKQAVEMAEAIFGFETANRYEVLGPQGQTLMRCGEKSSAVTRAFLGASRPMTIEVLDNNGKTLMSINRPFKMIGKNVEVGDGQGGALGVIRKKFAVTCKRFFVENSAGQLIYTLEGNALMPRKFKIMDNSGKEVGQVLKKWGGIAKEMFTDADTFTCFFPPGCDTITRALLVATTLFIDLTHFEK